MDINLFIVTSAAFLDSLNPCAISVLLLTIGFLFSLGKDKFQILKIGLIYTLAIYITYLLIGIGVLRALSFFGFPHILAKVGAFLLALTALINLVGALYKNFPIKLKIPNQAHPILAKYINQATISSAVILGILVGLFEFPCTGGPYLTILSLLHDKTTFTTGFLYLLYYNFIFVSPLIVILITASNKRVVEKYEYFKKNYTKKMDIVISSVMLVLSMVIFYTA